MQQLTENSHLLINVTPVVNVTPAFQKNISRIVQGKATLLSNDSRATANDRMLFMVFLYDMVRGLVDKRMALLSEAWGGPLNLGLLDNREEELLLKIISTAFPVEAIPNENLGHYLLLIMKEISAELPDLETSVSTPAQILQAADAAEELSCSEARTHFKNYVKALIVKDPEFYKTAAQEEEVRLAWQRGVFRTFNQITFKSRLKVGYRAFVSLIAINAFVKFFYFDVFGKLDPNETSGLLKFIFSPYGSYFLGTVAWAGSFSQFLSKTLWPGKAEQLWVVLESVAGAGVAALFTSMEPKPGSVMGYELPYGLVAFSAVVGVAMAVCKIPRYAKPIEHFSDKYPSRIGPTAPAIIYMAIALLGVAAGVNGFFKETGHPLESDRSQIFMRVIVTAALLIPQFFYYAERVIPNHAERMEKEQGLPKLTWNAFGLTTANEGVRNRQAECIFIIVSVAYLLTIHKDLGAIFKESEGAAAYIPHVMGILIPFLAGTIGNVWKNVFNVTETVRSATPGYLETLRDGDFGLTSGSATSVENAIVRGGETLHERMQKDQQTNQSGTRCLNHGEAALAASITQIAAVLVLVKMFTQNGLWDGWFGVKAGDTAKLFTDSLLWLSTSLVVRGAQYMIGRNETATTIFFEATTLPTRACRGALKLFGKSKKGFFDSVHVEVGNKDRIQRREYFRT